MISQRLVGDRCLPVAEQLGNERKRRVGHGAGMGETLDRGSMRELRAPAHRVDDVAHLVTISQGVDDGKRETDLGVERTEDEPLAAGFLHRGEKGLSSQAFIDERSMTSMPGSSFRIDWRVGPFTPISTPTVDSTIGTLKAFAALMSSCTLRSTSSAGGFGTDVLEHLLLIVDQDQGDVFVFPHASCWGHLNFTPGWTLDQGDDDPPARRNYSVTSCKEL